VADSALSVALAAARAGDHLQARRLLAQAADGAESRALRSALGVDPVAIVLLALATAAVVGVWLRSAAG
jgi:hypothetical protein